MAKAEHKKIPKRQTGTAGQESGGRSGVIRTAPRPETQKPSKAMRARRSSGQPASDCAAVHSYSSFKRIIEGPTFHPGDSSHSRESSQASTGSDCRRPDGEGLTGEQDQNFEADLRAERSSLYVGYLGPQAKQSITVKKHYPNNAGNHAGNRNQTQQSPDNEWAPTDCACGGFGEDSGFDMRPREILAQPGAHHQVKRSRQGRLFEGRTSYVDRPTPDGGDAPASTTASADGLRNAGARRTRPKLQRQMGVHIKEDIPYTSRPRPVSEFIPHDSSVDMVRLRSGGSGSAVRSYVNSAFIEDGALPSPLETIKEDVLVPSPSAAAGVSHKHSFLRGRPLATSSVTSQGSIHKGLSGIEMAPSREAAIKRTNPSFSPMKKTIDEVRQEQEQQTLFTKQYFEEKKKQQLKVNSFLEEGRHTNACNNFAVDVKSGKRDPQTNQKQREEYPGEGHGRLPSLQQHRSMLSLDISPERRRRRTYEISQSWKDLSQTQAVGLQKFVRDEDTKGKGAAIMVHVAQSPTKSQGGPEKGQPVVINVGEMTWERIKRQISRTSTYVVQQSKDSDRKRTKIARKPKTHFTLALFTLCFCLSPLGLIGMIFAVWSASAYKDKDEGMGRRLSQIALVLSIIGIIGTIATAAILVGTNTIPILGRYSEPEGNY